MRISTQLSIEGEDMLQELERHMVAVQKLGRGTIVTRRSRIRIFLSWLNNQPITPLLIEEFFYYLKTEKKLSNSSMNTYLTALHTLQKFLISRDHVEFLMGFSIFKEEEANIDSLTLEEVRLLRNHVYTHLSTNNALVGLLIDTGIRWQNAQGLLVSHVDIAGHSLGFIQKNKKRKVVHLEDPLLTILAKFIKNKSPDSLVFQNSKGGPIHQPDFSKYLSSLGKSLGITKPVSPHIIRHSYAQNHYDKTRDIYLTKDIIGHMDIRTTLRYAHNSRIRLMEAQQQHPHLEDSITPEMLINQVQMELANKHLDRNKKFNALKLTRAMNRFIEGLHEAIEQPAPSLNLKRTQA